MTNDSAFPALPAEIRARVDAVRSRTRLDKPDGWYVVPDPTDDLTPREIDVFALIAEGFTDAEIGERLGIARNTVMTHVKHLLRKTHSANRAHAVGCGFRLGVLH